MIEKEFNTNWKAFSKAMINHVVVYPSKLDSLNTHLADIFADNNKSFMPLTLRLLTERAIAEHFDSLMKLIEILRPSTRLRKSQTKRSYPKVILDFLPGMCGTTYKAPTQVDIAKL